MYIIHLLCLQSDRIFNGRMKYPLPNGMSVITEIGKGGNGFVFTACHDRKHFAIKKVKNIMW